MPRGLKNDFQIWKLARDLGLPATDPLGEIILYCTKWTRALLKEFPCESLSELLENAAARLDTVFREIHTDEELRQIRDHFLARGEKEFALVDHELGPGTFAITFRLLKPKRGEREFISIIDCRDDKRFRSYYSKWHELAHLITLTDQRRFKFCRTHSIVNKKDPEEALMEVIAGHVGFLPDLVKHHASGPISFQKIADVRKIICPDASYQASTIGLARSWPTPCVLLEATLEYKNSERDNLSQRTFSFAAAPKPELRITHITASQDAGDLAKNLHPHIRIPARSIIHKVFVEEVESADDRAEDLSWWETKKGGHLRSAPFTVSARKRGDSVQALLIPIARRNTIT
jgi:hypothetical protein